MAEPTEADRERVSGNCGTCQHWKRSREDFRSLVTGSTYGHPERDPDETYRRADEADRLYGECEAIPMGPADVDEDDPLPLALAIDGSQYMAIVYTRAEFGCVLHTPRRAAEETGQ